MKKSYVQAKLAYWEMVHFTSEFRFPSSAAIELATQSWHDWLDCLDQAQKRLRRKESFSEREWAAWVKGLDEEQVWNLAILCLDKLRLPRLWVKYWIACLVSIMSRLILQLLKEETISKGGKHPLSQLLQRVGSPLKGERSIELIATTQSDKLCALHKALRMNEYAYELVESLDNRQFKKVAAAAGNSRGDLLVLADHAEKQIPQAERRKIKDRVRKRVDNWFKAARRWPLPKKHSPE